MCVSHISVFQLMYVCMCMCVYVCMYICVYACIYLCMYVCMRACVGVYVGANATEQCIYDTTKQLLTPYHPSGDDAPQANKYHSVPCKGDDCRTSVGCPKGQVPIKCEAHLVSGKEAVSE